jgi:hypothetical protein
MIIGHMKEEFIFGRGKGFNLPRQTLNRHQVRGLGMIK